MENVTHTACNVQSFSAAFRSIRIDTELVLTLEVLTLFLGTT